MTELRFNDLSNEQWLSLAEHLLLNLETTPPIPFQETLQERLNWTYYYFASKNDRNSIDKFVLSLISTLITLPLNKHHRPNELFYETLSFIEEVNPIKHRNTLLSLLFNSDRMEVLTKMYFNGVSIYDFFVGVMVRTSINSEPELEFLLNKNLNLSKPPYAYLSMLYYFRNRLPRKAIATFSYILSKAERDNLNLETTWNESFNYSMEAIESYGVSVVDWEILAELLLKYRDKLPNTAKESLMHHISFIIENHFLNLNPNQPNQLWTLFIYDIFSSREVIAGRAYRTIINTFGIESANPTVIKILKAIDEADQKMAIHLTTSNTDTLSHALDSYCAYAEEEDLLACDYGD